MNMPLPIAAIYMAQRGRCFHCAKPMTMSVATKKAKGGWSQGWTREHVIPLSKGGRRGWPNIVLAHAACNMRRESKDLPPARIDEAARIRFIARDMIDTINVKKVANDPALREAHYVHYRNYDPGPGEPKFIPPSREKRA